MIINKGITLGKGLQVGESAIAYPTYSVSASRTSLTEDNESVIFTVTTTNIVDGTNLYWSLSGTFLTNQIAVTTGIVKVINHLATIQVTTIPNYLGTGDLSFQIHIHENSIQGVIVCTSAPVTIIDTSAASQNQVAYTTPGTYSWTAPAGVYFVHAVCVGGGGSGSTDRPAGGGGGLGWKNKIPVIPGQSYTVVVGSGGAAVSASGIGGPPGISGTSSYFISASTVMGGGGTGGGLVAGNAPGGTFVGDGGGNGGSGGITLGCNGSGGGGGAGGYVGNGGNGADYYCGLTPGPAAGSGNGGGGGGGGVAYGDTNGNGNFPSGGGGGGGVGILGQGPNGAPGSDGLTTATITGGGGGSNGTAGGNGVQVTFLAGTSGGSGGLYGAGGGGGAGSGSTGTYPRNSGAGGKGAVRIIWGPGRSFPSSLTEDLPYVP